MPTTSANLIDLVNSAIVSSVLDLVGVNYSVFDMNGCAVLQNRSMRTNISGEEILAENINKPAWEDCKSVMRSLKRRSTEEKFEGRVYLSVKQPLVENNTCVGILVISFDMTEGKQAEIAKQEFIMNMAHDIRTPLSGIIGLAQLQETETLANPEETKNYGRIIHAAANQLLELLNAVMRVIDAENVVDSVSMEPLDLAVLLREMRTLMAPAVRAKKLGFQLRIDKKIPVILSDRIKLKRVLMNLLSNAVKFTKKGKIGLSAHLLFSDKDRACVEIRVTDTGIGISEDHLDKIFDRFYRAHPSCEARYSGYGIGLYLVKETLGHLDGKIGVFSEEGKGSCFVVRLNSLVIPTASDVKQGSSLPRRTRIRSQSMLAGPVLIAEDSPLAQHAGKALLNKTGYTVSTAVDGQSTLEMLQTGSFSWVLLDIGLPGYSGIEVTRRFRQWEHKTQRPRLPIFALTGHGVDTVEQACLGAGVDRIFSKPLTQDMIREIEAILVAAKPALAKTTR